MLRMRTLTVLAAVWMVAPGAYSACADEAKKERAAVERGLKFLRDDAAKWRKEKKCASGRHGARTVWWRAEAKNQGYPVGDTLKEAMTWTNERFADLDKPRDTRAGWSMVNSPSLFLAMMATGVPGQDALSAKDLQR